jgi:soluble lytic murein transglycosylase-like protein
MNLFNISLIIGAFMLLKKSELFKNNEHINSGYNQVLYWRDIVKRMKNFHGNNIPDEIILGIIAQESMGNNDLKIGSSGEVGLMQIIPRGLAYTGLGYTMNQIKIDPKKNIEVGIVHLYKDFAYLGTIENAIMSYNISREHIRAILDGRSTAHNRTMVSGIGKSYLTKVMIHSKIIRERLNNPNINDPVHTDFITYKAY